jgi:hypothetical protein
MDSLDRRAEELRAEIDRLKTALLATTTETERFELHAQLDTCIRESLALIEQRLQISQAFRLRERRVGQD